MDKDRISTYYVNARELVKRNNPKAARAYVVAILNCALQTYQTADTILIKARTAAFMDKWIAVSRDLYDKGVTDFVLDCFGLPVANRDGTPKVSGAKPREVPPAKNNQPDGISPQPPLNAGAEDKPFTPTPDGGVDFTGLIEEAAKTQGWCAEIFKNNKSAVVEISASSSGHGADGTGFIISANGYLLTNDHVVYDERTGNYYPKTRMNFVDSKKSYKINVLFSDKKADIALCSFNPAEVESFTAVRRIADYKSLLQGADCLVIGNAFGMGLAPITGMVRYTKNNKGNLVYTVPTNPGDSGGPVFNRQGECIGINKSKTVAVGGEAADGYANATPMDRIEELLKKWTEANGISL